MDHSVSLISNFILFFSTLIYLKVYQPGAVGRSYYSLYKFLMFVLNLIVVVDYYLILRYVLC